MFGGRAHHRPHRGGRLGGHPPPRGDAFARTRRRRRFALARSAAAAGGGGGRRRTSQDEVSEWTTSSLGGWTVAKTRGGGGEGGTAIGEVIEVVKPANGVGHALLNVRMLGGGQEHRLVPLVLDIVPTYDAERTTLFLDPPAGLLDLDSRMPAEGDLQWLEREMSALWASSARSSTEPRLPPGRLPSSSQFRSAGRADLQRVVDDHGGHYEVAACLGIKPYKNPPGYWDLDSIDLEVSDLLESLWEPSSKGGFGEIHALTGEARRRPSSSEAGDGSEDAIATSLLPNRKALLDSGRHDLVYAIKMHGGFREVAGDLGRVLYSAKAVHRLRLRRDFGYLADQLSDLMGHPDCLRECPEMDKLPPQRLLRELGRYDIDEGVKDHGGYYAVARRMNLRATSSRPYGYWSDKANLIREIRAFAASASGSASAKHPEASVCPPYSALESAGRLDLKYAIEVHGGRKAVEKDLQNRDSSRGAKKQ